MEAVKRRGREKAAWMAAVFILVNLLTMVVLWRAEETSIDCSLAAHTGEIRRQFDAVMDRYERSFRIFAQMMSREIENNPDPEDIWTYLKSVDAPLLDIEGDTFDGLYMYYRGRYLYSWDTPYSVYEDSGYEATERPWYRDAVAGGGEIVFTPPYMSYANHYILTTISQLQPDGETVFAYDIKMEDIQALVTSIDYFNREQVLIYDRNGTVIGSTNPDYLGGNLAASAEASAQAVSEAEAALAELGPDGGVEADKLREQLTSATAFHAFREHLDAGLPRLLSSPDSAVSLRLDGAPHYGYLLRGEDFHFLCIVPAGSALAGTLGTWLVPLLVVELLLIYILGRAAREVKNRELREAYVELGQTQRRLEIALNAAQKAAAVDELTGMMNFRSFQRGMCEALEAMSPEESGVYIMIDGDHFKHINDTYGHSVGDEVIKLTAQMIVGRIRTIDLASRLHGDEFAIFVSNTSDCEVARRIMADINATLAKEARRRNMPSITLSAGAVVARHGASLTALAKEADTLLYRAKETHNGGFAC